MCGARLLFIVDVLQPVTASGLLPPFLADATCISKQLSPNLQQGNAAGAVLCTARHCDETLRQDTATRHCGKTLRQGNTAGAAERLSGRHCGHMRQGTTAKHWGRHYGKKTPRQDTAAKIHCGTVARKCDMWQESATCIMALRHATATKPKKEGVGGGVHDALRGLVICYG